MPRNKSEHVTKKKDFKTLKATLKQVLQDLKDSGYECQLPVIIYKGTIKFYLQNLHWFQKYFYMQK